MRNDVINSYFNILGEELARIVVTFLAAVAINAALLFGTRIGWALFTETNTGNLFLQKNENFGVQIHELLAQPIFEFSLSVSQTVFEYVLFIAVVMHFLFIRNLLYEPFSIVVKGVWVLLITFALVPVIQKTVNVPQDYIFAYIAILPSVLCSLPMFLVVLRNAVPDVVTMAVRSMEWLNNK